MILHLKNTVKSILNMGHGLTAVADRPYLRGRTELISPPVFILGPPRSGTTLLYQLLLHSFEFAYLPNIANTFYMCPIFATQMGKKFLKEHHPEFSSRYGYEKGLMAASEAGNIWNRWFPHEKREGFTYTPDGYLSMEHQTLIFQLVSQLTGIFQAPFLTKNVKMSVRIPTLCNIFPDALFIRIQRNPTHSATSILVRRRRDNLKWLSVMPKEIDQIRDLSDVAQVSNQVVLVERNIEEDIQRFATDKNHIVSYDDLCEQPAIELQKIHQFLVEHSCQVKLRGRSTPTSFPKSEPATLQWVSQEEIADIERIIAEIRT